MFIVLAHWNNSPRVDKSLPSDTLFWFLANQSYSLTNSTNAKFIVFDLHSKAGSTTLEETTLTITPPRMFSPVPDVKYLPSIVVMLTLLTIYVMCVCLRIVLSNTFCVAYFFFFVFVLYTLCCQFLLIVHLWLTLRYSLTLLNAVFSTYIFSLKWRFHNALNIHLRRNG